MARITETTPPRDRQFNLELKELELIALQDALRFRRLHPPALAPKGANSTFSADLLDTLFDAFQGILNNA